MLQLAVRDITDWSQVPGSNTCFRTSDVAPQIKDGQLNIFNARGQSRSWGTPRVTSTVKPLSDDVVMVNVVGWHKHTVSPVGGNFYFVREGGEWVRRMASHKSVKPLLN